MPWCAASGPGQDAERAIRWVQHKERAYIIIYPFQFQRAFYFTIGGSPDRIFTHDEAIMVTSTVMHDETLCLVPLPAGNQAVRQNFFQPVFA